jgi:hypothetical protein
MEAMKRLKEEFTVTAAKRCEMLIAAQHHAEIKVGAILHHAGAPKAYAAYRRFMRSMRANIFQAMRQKLKEEQ